MLKLRHSKKSNGKRTATAVSHRRSILNSSLLLNTIILLSVIDVSKAGCAITPDNNGKVVISNTVTSIGGADYNGCTELISLEFTGTSSLTTIEGYAFNGCTNLASVTIPASVVTISENAFYECTSLASVTFDTNSQLATMGNGAFKGAIFTSITLPHTLTSIGDYAFFQTSLQTVTMSNHLSELASIGTSAFQFSALTEFICPQALTSIGVGSFADTPMDTFVVDCHSTMTIAENALVQTPNLPSIELPAGATCDNCGVTTTTWSQGACNPTQSPTAAPTQAPDSDTDTKEDSNSVVVIVVAVVAVVAISVLGYIGFVYTSDAKTKEVELVAGKDAEAV